MQVLENGDLLIAAVRESDAGVYSCLRANEAGQAGGTAYISVLGTYCLKMVARWLPKWRMQHVAECDTNDLTVFTFAFYRTNHIHQHLSSTFTYISPPPHDYRSARLE